MTAGGFRHRLRSYYRDHYRLPPEAAKLENLNPGSCIRWNGTLVSRPQRWRVRLSKERARSRELFKTALANTGVPLVWFDDLPVTDPDFAAIHLAAVRGWYPLGRDLHASPDAPLTRAEAAQAVAASQGHPVSREAAVKLALGWMVVDHRNWLHPDLPFDWPDLRETNLRLPAFEMTHTGPVKRWEWARRFRTVT